MNVSAHRGLVLSKPLSGQPQARMLPPQTRAHHYALKGKATSFQMPKKDYCEIKPTEPSDYQTESQGSEAAHLARCHLNKAAVGQNLEWQGTCHFILEK